VISINITLGLILIFFAFSLFYTALNTGKKIPIAVNIFLFILIIAIFVWLNILNVWLAIGALVTVAVILFIFKKSGKKK